MLVRVLFYLLVLTMLQGTLSAVVNSLNGKHLRVLAMEFPVSFESQRNATGHIVICDGIQKHMIQALSQTLNFSYSFLPIVALLSDDTPSARGGISYLMEDEADFYLSSSLATTSRVPKVDFPSAWSFWPASTLLPYPKETLFNLAAFLEPLSYKVWILIAVSALVSVLYIKMVSRKNSLCQICRTKRNGARKSNRYNSRESATLYVMGNLLSQGQHFYPKRLVVRLVAGAWCCTCFFLVQIYCSTLTSHLTSPNQTPIINSFFEIADTRGLSLSVDKGRGLEIVMQNTEGVYLQRFVQALKKDNRFVSCKMTSDCLDYVRNGNAVYSAPSKSLSVIMAADLKNNNGTCRYTRTKETFWSQPTFTLLPKSSPYTEPMSIGILRLQQAGLLDKWESWYVPSPSKCMKINQQNAKPRLSIKHLSSAFVILIVGYIISLVVFVAERIVKKM